jgi:hypothetical protein
MNLDPWAQTFSGRKFYLLNPTPTSVCIEDIANGLAFKCRYNGQCSRFYSVAQHSILITHVLPSANPLDKLWALLHDAGEAYLPDIPRPYKHLFRIGTESFSIPFSEVEDNILHTISLRFNLTTHLPPSIVKVADDRILVDEYHALMRRDRVEWPSLASIEGFGIKIKPWSPEKSKKIFLDVLHKLLKEVNYVGG